MAISAQISSTFVISVTLTTAATHTVENPGRSFRVIQIMAYNSGGTPTLNVTNGAADIVPTGPTGTNGWTNMPLIAANCNLTDAQNIVITNAHASTTKILIFCVAIGGGEALSAS